MPIAALFAPAVGLIAGAVQNNPKPFEDRTKVGKGLARIFAPGSINQPTTSPAMNDKQSISQGFSGSVSFGQAQRKFRFPEIAAYVAGAVLLIAAIFGNPFRRKKRR